MTVHIFLTLITSFLLLFGLKKVLKNNKDYFPSAPVFTSILILFPMGFGAMTALCHILFEVSSDRLGWYILLQGAILIYIAKLLWDIFFYVEMREISNNFLILLLFFIFQLFWYLLAITQSHYETGPTPIITKTPELFIYWMSIQAFIIIALIKLICFYHKSKKKLSMYSMLFFAFLNGVIVVYSLCYT